MANLHITPDTKTRPTKEDIVIAEILLLKNNIPDQSIVEALKPVKKANKHKINGHRH